MSKPDDNDPLKGILLQYEAMIEENTRLRRKVAKPKGKAEAKRLKRQRDCTNKFRNRVI